MKVENPLLIAVFVLTVGCGSVRRGEPIAGPIPNPTPEIERGRVAFNQHCHQCHPGGEGGLGPGLNDKPAPVWLMKTQVRLGLGTMPSFSEEQLPPEELDALMVYLKALKKNS